MKKISKYKKHLQAGIGLTLMLSLLAACSTGEEPLGGTASRAHLSITTESIGTGNTRAGDTPHASEPGTVEERSYNGLYIYYMAGNGGEQLNLQKITDTGVLPRKVDVPEEVSTHVGPVEIYVFSSPSPTTAMPEVATRDDLRALLTNGMVTGLSGGNGQLMYPDGTTRCLPMAGSITNTFSEHNLVSVSLRRAVAKFRIRIENNLVPTAGSTIQLLTDRMTVALMNLRVPTPLLPPVAGTLPPATALFNSQRFSAAALPGSTDAFVPQTTADGKLWLHTAYVNEHLFDTAPGVALPTDRAALKVKLPYTITTGGETTTEDNNYYTLPLDFPLERNHIYQITVRVYGPGDQITLQVEIRINILDWVEKDADPIT